MAKAFNSATSVVFFGGISSEKSPASDPLVGELVGELGGLPSRGRVVCQALQCWADANHRLEHQTYTGAGHRRKVKKLVANNWWLFFCLIWNCHHKSWGRKLCVFRSSSSWSSFKQNGDRSACFFPCGFPESCVLVGELAAKTGEHRWGDPGGSSESFVCSESLQHFPRYNLLSPVDFGKPLKRSFEKNYSIIIEIQILTIQLDILASRIYAFRSPYQGQLTMSLIEMPSLILQLARTRCILHEGQQASLLSVPGMSGEHDKLSEVMKSGDGLSPEQLPLEFLKWPEEWPEDEAISLMIRDRLRPEAIFTVHPEVVLEGEDILMQTMSLPAAKVRCTSLPNCIGFYSDDWPSDLRNEARKKWDNLFVGEIDQNSSSGVGRVVRPLLFDEDVLKKYLRYQELVVTSQVDVHFKTTWKPKPVASRSSSSAVAYQKERASPLFTRREGYGLDGAELFVAEMTIEAAKRCCSDLENCMGFTLKSHLSSSCSCSLIQFKSGTKLLLDSTSCCYVLETESRSLHLPADGNAFFQLMDEGNEGIGAESP